MNGDLYQQQQYPGRKSDLGDMMMKLIPMILAAVIVAVAILMKPTTCPTPIVTCPNVSLQYPMQICNITNTNYTWYTEFYNISNWENASITYNYNSTLPQGTHYFVDIGQGMGVVGTGG